MYTHIKLMKLIIRYSELVILKIVYEKKIISIQNTLKFSNHSQPLIR